MNGLRGHRVVFAVPGKTVDTIFMQNVPGYRDVIQIELKRYEIKSRLYNYDLDRWVIQLEELRG